MLTVERTVISQYANSPTIVGIVQSMNDAIDPRVNLQGFYDWCWNVDTAVGKGLDIWGNIVGVSRLLRVIGDVDAFGFVNATIPYDWQPFNQGSFYSGGVDTQAYLLPDSVYRTLVLTKALANIVSTTAQNLNTLLRNLFPNRGRCYVVDNGGMSMTFTFEFELSLAEYAILTQSGVLPHPAGVMYNVHVIPTATFFGFSEALPAVLPFDFGVFYAPPG
jgi:hypothetical protein